MSEFPDWVRGILLMGTDGVSYLPIVTDASGNLIAVMKGEYAGALKTVKVDSEGRLSAFVIDSVDAWGEMLSIGLAELAARLGSLSIYDRRGQIIWSDNFSQGFGPYSLSQVGAGSTPVLDGSRYMFGGYSAKLSVTNLVADRSSILISIGETVSGGLGLECTFQNNIANGRLHLWIIATAGGRFYTPGLRYDAEADQLHYYNDAGAWTLLDSGLIAPYGQGSWNRIKIVADLGTQKYIRALFNRTEYDLSAQSLNNWAAATLNYLGLDVYLTGSGTNNPDWYIDSILATNMES